MQCQHTFKGPRLDLSKKIQILFFFPILNVLNVLKYGYYFKMLYQIGNSISELQANYRVYLCVVLVYVLSNNCLFLFTSVSHL